MEVWVVVIKIDLVGCVDFFHFVEFICCLLIMYYSVRVVDDVDDDVDNGK